MFTQKTVVVVFEEVKGEKMASCTFEVENSGATPCKRLEILGGVDVLPYGDDIVALPDTSSDEWSDWSALPGTEVLEARKDLPMTQTNHFTKDFIIHIGGSVRYNTFFDEESETEFSFMLRGGPLLQGHHLQAGTHRMSRTRLKINAYGRQL